MKLYYLQISIVTYSVGTNLNVRQTYDGLIIAASDEEKCVLQFNVVRTTDETEKKLCNLLINSFY